jgi:thiamine pyrophosphokinase
MNAIIFVGGRCVVTPRLRHSVAEAQLLIAADGGIHHALALGITPHHWVGDFDSTDDHTLATVAIPRAIYPREKDKLDSELAIALAIAQGAQHIVLIGAFGGRFDHALALALIAAKYAEHNLKILLDSGDELGGVVCNGQQATLMVDPGQIISLLTLSGPARVSIDGVLWPLGNAELEFGSGLGVSNQVTSVVTLTVHAGMVLWVAQYN